MRVFKEQVTVVPGIVKVGHTERKRIVVKVGRDAYVILPAYFSLYRPTGRKHGALSFNIADQTRVDSPPVRIHTKFKTAEEFMGVFAQIASTVSERGLLVKDIFSYCRYNDEKTTPFGVKLHPGVSSRSNGDGYSIYITWRKEQTWIGAAWSKDGVNALNEKARIELLARGAAEGLSYPITIDEALKTYTRKELDRLGNISWVGKKPKKV